MIEFKKVITLSTTASIALTLFSLPAYADNISAVQETQISSPAQNDVSNIFDKQNLVVTYEAQEITDLKELEKRAEEGISDLSTDEISSAPNIQLDLGSSDENTKVIRTAQILQTAQNEDGIILNKVAITSFSYDESKYSSGNDSTLGNKAYSTIYIDDWFDPRGVKYWDLQHVSGGWALDSGVSISSGTITAGQSGATYGRVGFSQNKTWNVSGTTFSYDVPPSWEPVTSNGGSGILSTVVGVSTKVNYKKGTTTWSHSLTNNFTS
ncbi:hypothetical protein OIN60_11475 [Paenibacillus sp. P96]|uniref:Uncharacterized protein n=1 Tax=Paenibacillus zeirhizosphaerae TaxID=2987519 RepID=A0ABT9FRU4_9BACL|nr:hypothetical protein [Paenibacillus sp. P96]MDP4097389.1 hypothetical protein [Paenibacillus sp. P96]